MGSDFPMKFSFVVLESYLFCFYLHLLGIFSPGSSYYCLQYCLYHSTNSFLCYTKNMDCLHQCFRRYPILDCQQGTSLHATTVATGIIDGCPCQLFCVHSYL